MGVIYLQHKCRAEYHEIHSSNFDHPEKRPFIAMPQPAFRMSLEFDRPFSINDSGGHHRINQLTDISKFVVGN